VEQLNSTFLKDLKEEQERFTVKSIGGNVTEQLLSEPLVLEESEILTVTAADANRLHVVASILEINREDR
jgi:hypothetical protein